MPAVIQASHAVRINSAEGFFSFAVGGLSRHFFDIWKLRGRKDHKERVWTTQEIPLENNTLILF